MNTTDTALLTRRDCCKRMALGAAALAAPLIIPSRLLRGDTAPGSRIRVGQIGCGRIARSHDIPGVYTAAGADYVAVCDVDSKRLQNARVLLEKFYKEDEKTPPHIATYADYREMLARADIDAVVISTPDHQHAEPALAAVLAGKDVYLQKPATLTHAEGVVLRDAAARAGRVVQIGSQRRSQRNFRTACELVRNGRVGRLARVEIGMPADPTAPDKPGEPVPGNLDYERWLGPAADAYYTEQRVHPQKDFGRPGWLRNDAFCLGMITGWGAHFYDIAHWGMDCEHTGPARVEGRADFPKNKIWNVHGAYEVHLEYPGGIQMAVSDKFPDGLRFIGDEGWIFVSYSAQHSPLATAPDGKLKPLDASKPSLLDSKNLPLRLPVSTDHHRNWLESVRTHRAPIAPIAIGHHSNTACIVSWIAMKLGRPLAWDASAGRFINAPDANALLTRPERAPHGALALAASCKDSAHW